MTAPTVRRHHAGARWEEGGDGITLDTEKLKDYAD